MHKKEVKKKVLIVDDDVAIRVRYVELLSRANFDCDTASSADEANEILKINGIDLVLLDIKMPSVEGSTLYETMQLFHNGVKVIVSSVYPIEEQKKMVQGAAAYYDKSEGITVLIDKIREVLNDG
ncbi:MAG: response regulator [Candidatus Omnitrophica bacterium]|nr:response regulator [Candidatus Omnitrophota bacterium]MBU1925971.1 response regulator [Candidatus Omnitrophota bacterium]